MSDPVFERLLAVLSDVNYDFGPELPVDEQPDPGDPGLWVIWSGGRIKAGHDLSAARADRAWARLREQGYRPELGEGMFPEPVPVRPVERLVPAGDWAGAL